MRKLISLVGLLAIALALLGLAYFGARAVASLDRHDWA